MLHIYVPLQIVLIVRKAKKTHKDLFISPKIGHFDQIWQKIAVFYKNEPFMPKTRQTAIYDFSSLGNFTPENNKKHDFLKFWFFGAPDFGCLIPPNTPKQSEHPSVGPCRQFRKAVRATQRAAKIQLSRNRTVLIYALSHAEITRRVTHKSRANARQ